MTTPHGDDVLAGPNAPRRPRRERVDWLEARRMVEVDGASFTAVSEALGPKRQTVSARAAREGWIIGEKRTEIGRETAAAVLREYVEQNTQAVLDNLAVKHGLNRRLLRLVDGHVERLEQDRMLMIKSGVDRHGEPIYVEENPVKSIRDLAATVKTVEDVDVSLLRDAAWRPSADGAPKLPDLPQDFDFSCLRKPKQAEVQ